jgi:hypothetical protein
MTVVGRGECSVLITVDVARSTTAQRKRSRDPFGDEANDFALGRGERAQPVLGRLRSPRPPLPCSSGICGQPRRRRTGEAQEAARRRLHEKSFASDSAVSVSRTAELDVAAKAARIRQCGGGFGQLLPIG